MVKTLSTDSGQTYFSVTKGTWAGIMAVFVIGGVMSGAVQSFVFFGDRLWGDGDQRDNGKTREIVAQNNQILQSNQKTLDVIAGSNRMIADSMNEIVRINQEMIILSRQSVQNQKDMSRDINRPKDTSRQR